MAIAPTPAPLHQRLPRNLRGRDLVIGDIHGHYARVEAELERIGFDPGRDRLICCGDLVDRGPDSARALEWLESGWFFAAMGNHDASLLQRQGLLSAKFELWHDYHGWFGRMRREARQRLLDRLAALPWALEIETAAGAVGVVHAEVPMRFERWPAFLAALDDEEIRSLAASSRTLVRQAGDLGDEDIGEVCRLEGIAWVIHGHTPRRGCRVGRLGNRLWIDTMGWYERMPEEGRPRFTVVDAADPVTAL